MTVADGVRGTTGIDFALCSHFPAAEPEIKKTVTVHAMCYRSRMTPPKCKLCGDRHYGVCPVSAGAEAPGRDGDARDVAVELPGLPAAEVDKVLSPGGRDVAHGYDPDARDVPIEEKKSDAVPDAKVSENDTAKSGDKYSKNYSADVCPTCGTNLAARRKERERRREYMKRKRAEGKVADE